MVDKHHVIITGPVNSGKTTLLYALCSRLDSLGHTIGGVSQVMPLPHQNKREWILSDQGSGECNLLMTTEPHSDWSIFGRFWYDQNVFNWATDLLLHQRNQYDVLTVDEVGPIELAGGGLHDAYAAVVRTYKGLLVTVIREQLVNTVVSHFGIDEENVLIIHSDKDKESELKKVVSVE